MKRYSKNYKNALEYIKLQKEVKSIQSVCDLYGCERHVLSKYLAQKIDLSNCYAENDDYCFDFAKNEEEALNLYQESEISIKEICLKTKVSETSLMRWIQMLDIPRRGVLRKYNFDQNIFKKIDSEEKAYWIGFITADGYINEKRGFLNIKLQKQDENHLIKFKNFIGCSELPIKDDIGGSGQIIKSLTVNSKVLINDLVQLGIRQGKSGKESVCSVIPEHLIPHYIRGLIDGDGSISQSDKPTIQLVGSYEIVNFLKTYINQYIYEFNPKYSYICEHGTIYKFAVSNLICVLKCYDCFYKNAKIFLDRKYEKILDFYKNYGRG